MAVYFELWDPEELYTEEEETFLCPDCEEECEYKLPDCFDRVTETITVHCNTCGIFEHPFLNKKEFDRGFRFPCPKSVPYDDGYDPEEFGD